MSQDLPTKNLIRSELCRRDLRLFIKQMWPAVETVEYTPGKHIDAICEHLQAVTNGDIKKLIINIPPRHMKSLSVAVFWPLWHWLNLPSTQFLFASYAHNLSIRDSVKCRNVFLSPQYQSILEILNPELQLKGSQNTKVRWENTENGYRLSTSVSGALTGEGGDIIVADDPHNVVEAESAQERNNVIQWWTESMTTRKNSADGAMVIIMQRVHENDLVGYALKHQMGWEHLCLPAEYEGKNRIHTSLEIKDWRKESGEVLWPERFKKETLMEMKADMGEYASACQLQQRPAPREGGFFKPGKIEIMEHPPPENEMDAIIRYWDKAGTRDAGSWCVGVKMGRMRRNKWEKYVILDVVRMREDAFQRETMIQRTAAFDGKKIRIGIEQEPGSGGKDSAKYTIMGLAGYSVEADTATKDKESRAEPFATQVNAGNVAIVKSAWNKVYLEELKLFPNSEFNDQVDASSGAFNKLALAKRGGTWRK